MNRYELQVMALLYWTTMRVAEKPDVLIDAYFNVENVAVYRIFDTEENKTLCFLYEGKVWENDSR